MPFDLNSTGARAGLAAALLVVGLIVGWFGHKAIASPPDIPTISVYQDWRITCPASTDKDATCEIQSDVVDAKSHSELARISIYRLKGADKMVITVPFNVLLEPGIGLGLGQASDKPRLFPFETCNDVGCLVNADFDSGLEKAIGAAPQPRILLAGLDGKPVGLPFSLKGYKEVMAVYKNTEAKRHSWFKRMFS